MACRRSSRVASLQSTDLELTNKSNSSRKVEKTLHKNQTVEKLAKNQKIISKNKLGHSNETDFSKIEEKIFEGTGLVPDKQLMINSTKRCKLANSGTNDKNEKASSTQVSADAPRSKFPLKLEKEVSHDILSNKKEVCGSSFVKKIKANPPVTKKGCLKTHDLNPDQIRMLVKTLHPRASEVLPKLTIENLRASSKTSNSSRSKNDKSKGGVCDREGNAEKPPSVKKKVCEKEKEDGKRLPHKVLKKNKSRHPKKQSASGSDQSDWEDVGGNNHDAENWDDIDSLMVKDEAAALSLLAKIDAKDGKKEDAALATAPVQIELDAPTLWGSRHNKKRKSEEYWMMQHFRLGVNRNIRENYINCHKVHLLLLFGHGLHINRLLNSEELLACALSIITNKEVYPPKRINLSYLEKFSNWYCKKISRVDSTLEKFYWLQPLTVFLKERFEKRQAKSAREFVYMFILIARALGMSVRLVQSIRPMHYRPSSEELFKPINEDGSENLKEPGPSSSKSSNQPHNGIEPKLTDHEASKAKKQRMLSSDSDVDLQSLKKPVKKRVGKKTCTERSENEDDDSSDSDFYEMERKKRKSKKKGKGNSSSSSSSKSSSSISRAENKRSLSKDAADQPSKKKRVEDCNEWAEVYVEEEERWVCIDIIRNKIHCAAELASRAGGPVAYVTAFNADQSVKDVTRRYVAKWLSFENKLRCDSAWWQEVLAPYAPTFTARERAENLQLEETLRQQPLPKTIAEYKDHPMFALQRHLLKFEAFYPPNPDPVGYVRGEAVYPRECVYTLHSRDIWKKDGKTVKVGEEPYKIVKARPKWDRALCQVIKDLPLEIFGPWQVEDYQPPVAKGGRVPRNEYGNVELFKKTMLPVGTVHLDARYEDLSRVARKLKIDCAPAMVGFDYHKGGTHPVYDGYVVCQEFKDVLLDAWTEEMQLKAKREEAKRLRRIYDNWKRLIQGILIKNHVREKYGQDSDHDEPSSSKNSKSKSNEKSLKPQKKMKQTDKVAVKSETEEKVRLGIDMNSDTVAMAKMSFKASLSSRGMVLQPKTAEDEALAAIEAKPEDLILDSDEEVKETEEEKKEKLRKILAWNSSKLGSMANLSDDSDADENVGDEPDRGADKLSRGESTKSSVASSRKVLTSESSDESDSRTAKKTRVSRTSQEVTKTSKHCKRLSLAGRNASKSKGRSTKSKENVAASDESNGKTLVPTHERRTKRQSTTRKNVDYKESEESDISLDESDVEDKTYKPESLFKPRQSNVALSEESD